MDINSIKKDSSLIAGGQWVGDIPDFGDVRLRVRGLTSPQVVTLRSRLERAVPKNERNRDGTLKYEANIRVFGQVLSEAVLLEWEGITDGGEPVPYTKEQAANWLTDPDFRTFADAVTWAASVVDGGNADATDELAGNSQKLSAGK